MNTNNRSTTKRLAILALLAFFPFSAFLYGTPIQNSLKAFYPSNTQLNDNFGFATALLGSYSFSSAPRFQTDHGRVFVHKFNGVTWTPVTEIAPAGLDPNDQFGYSMGNSSAFASLIIGAIGDDDGGIDAGAAYIYSFLNGTPNLQAKLSIPGTAGSQIGTAVDIAGNYAAVSSVQSNGNTGVVYVYKRTSGVWNLSQTLFSPTPLPNHHFGVSVSFDDFGNTLVVGESQNLFGNTTGNGAAHVFTRTGSTWTLNTSLTDPNGAWQDGFGYDVAVGGNVLAVSSPGDDVNGVSNAGSTCIFRNVNGSWVMTDKIWAYTPELSANYGFSIAFATADKLLVGAPFADFGSIQNDGIVYRVEFDGVDWIEEEKLNSAQVGGSSSSEQLMGFSVAANNWTALAGAIQYENGSTDPNVGRCYAWRYDFKPTVRPRRKMAEATMGSEALVYPNPAQNWANVEWAPFEEAGEIKLYSSAGTLVRNQKVNHSFARLDLLGLPKGVYFLHLSAGIHRKSLRLLVQ